MLGFLASSLVLLAAQPTIAKQLNAARVLIYSATADFRHDSIPTAVNALVQSGSRYTIAFDHTEDKTWFTDDTLAQYDAVLFLSCTGEVLDDAGKAAFRNYIDLGGNFVGVHAASDALRNTTWFQHEVGAAFDYHPELSNANVDVVGPSHPSTAGLPNVWPVRDEMYNFKSDPRTIGAVVVLSADESSYTDPGPRKFDQGTPHPTAWYQEHGAGIDANGTAGRIGHLNETWQDSLFLGHVFGGITWALQSNTTRAFNANAKVGNGLLGSNSTSTASGASSTPSSSSTASTTNSGVSVASSAGMLLLCLALFTSSVWTVHS